MSPAQPEEVKMPKKVEVREDDTITLKATVTRVSDDGELVTIEVWGQKITAPIGYVRFERIEKGRNWPD